MLLIVSKNTFLTIEIETKDEESLLSKVQLFYEITELNYTFFQLFRYFLAMCKQGLTETNSSTNWNKTESDDTL